MLKTACFLILLLLDLDYTDLSRYIDFAAGCHYFRAAVINILSTSDQSMFLEY